MALVLPLLTLIIFFLIFMDSYKTKVNTEKILKQNELIMERLNIQMLEKGLSGEKLAD